MLRLGIDVGSTTVKLLLLGEDSEILYKQYSRHRSAVFQKVKEMLRELQESFGGAFCVGVTGSAGMELSQRLGLPFTQEVIACTRAVQELQPRTDVVIELGGEDAKITFFGDSVEQRMNGSCAGGTGAFIDQMALLLHTDAGGLDRLAKDYKNLYPIAARCGVFAKTDIQPLINDGVPHEDLAASIFQAVVDQTITGLACGCRIQGNVTFLGGPLTFLPELRQRFIETLRLGPEQVCHPENAQFYVAIGAAMESKEQRTAAEMLEALENAEEKSLTATLPPLFESREEYDDFKARQDRNRVPKGDLEKARGPLFLGLDAGSTTTKMAVTDKKGNLLFSDYSGNGGDPVGTSLRMLGKLYEKLPQGAYIARATSTGYGEALMKSALHMDGGQVETIAHYAAAKRFQPEVDFILDIGGQDMKCIIIRDGAIEKIVLNEACSSGCGSFIETFAKSLNLGVSDFAEMALFAEHPVDLGSRCTVFMNSKIKQVQKEGASVGDIAAGLAYSVVKNSLYKVIKLRSPQQVGRHVVVQGGTFYNDGVLRSLEKILDREVIRPDIAGIMGAYGAALISQEDWEARSDMLARSAILNGTEIANFSMESSHSRCQGCRNRCQLTVCRFGDGSRHISGNRCEKGSGGKKAQGEERNLFRYKYRRLFSYQPLEESKAKRGTIGIPRVLNMYENYPFWFTFFTKLGFRVVLSPPSGKDIYHKGLEYIPSDTACYPAKLVHGHVAWLLEQGVERIFYPSLSYELWETPGAGNHFNCPVVALYPEVIAGNMAETIANHKAFLLHPFLDYSNDQQIVRAMEKTLQWASVPVLEIAGALEAARKEDRAFKADVEKKADEFLAAMEREGGHGIVLAGRPYHLDPEVNHGIDQIIASYGYYVFTESSVARRQKQKVSLRVLDQWSFHSRLYRAAQFCAERRDLDLVQLTSFGCGVDAITTEQVEEILESHGKLYTLLKVDEGVNLGAVRIRLRSLFAAISARKIRPVAQRQSKWLKRPFFTEEMKQKYTVLIPQMAPIHFDLIETAFKMEGFKAELLPEVGREAVETGLKYINNDACYPAIVSLGQILHALLSGRYDLDRTAVMMVQTGGACRASNYIALLRKALKDLRMEQIPVVSFNADKDLEQNPGMRFTPSFLIRLLLCMVYGDLFMRVTNAVRPYELEPGSTNALYDKWRERAKVNIRALNVGTALRDLKKIVREFDELPIDEERKKPRVGVVGEILVKYHPDANNHIVETIEAEGGEAVVPDLLDFFMYYLRNMVHNRKEMGGSYLKAMASRLVMRVGYLFRRPMERALKRSKRFSAPHNIEQIAEKASRVISLGAQCGEGWILAGEMQELLDEGTENIVCLQPFGCLPNHIVGKGVMKPVRRCHPGANIVAIDYDPGASEVNQLNRIKLMMSVAHKKMNAGKDEPENAAAGRR